MELACLSILNELPAGGRCCIKDIGVCLTSLYGTALSDDKVWAATLQDNPHLKVQRAATTIFTSCLCGVRALGVAALPRFWFPKDQKSLCLFWV